MRGLFGFDNVYPYTDFHELNLDWILSLIRRLSNEMEAFVNVNTIKYADPILWNIATQYEQNTLVQDADGITYLSKKAVPVGINITNTDYWLKVADFSQLADIIKRSIATADDGSATTSSANRTEGELLWLNNYLYQVVRTINIGDAYVIGGINPNIVAITVEQLIDSILSQGNIIKEAIAAADDEDSATSTANRAVGDLVWLEDVLYEVIATITAGDAYVIGTNIQAVTVEQLLDDLRNDITTIIIPALDTIRASIATANDHDSATSTANRAVGELVWSNDTLYEVIAAITAGDAYVIGTNIQAVTVEQLLGNINGDITTLQGDIVRIDTTIAGLADPAIANVKEYGATGDGVTDDTAAVNLAIADINSGTKNVLYFPVGTYKVGNLTPITQGCLIHGQSKENSIIYGRTGHGTIFDLQNFPSGCICDLSFIDEDRSTYGDGYYAYVSIGNFVRLTNIYCDCGKFAQIGNDTDATVTGFATQVDNITGIVVVNFLKLTGTRSVTYVMSCVVNSLVSATGSECITISPVSNEYDTLVVSNCALQVYSNCFVIGVNAGKTASNVWVNDCVLDQIQDRCVIINNYGNFYRFYANNTWFASVGQPILIQNLGSGNLADINVRNCNFNYTLATYLMDFKHLKGLTFDGNIINSFDNGMVIDFCEYVRIINNKIGPNGGNNLGTYVFGLLLRQDSHVLVANNDFVGCSLGVSLGTGPDANTDYRVFDNLNAPNDTDIHEVGEVRYDTVNNNPEYWNGSSWVAF